MVNKLHEHYIKINKLDKRDKNKKLGKRHYH